MGIVLKQSFINTLMLFLGFAIGGVNVLFLFTHFLHEDYFGLITFLLSAANIILPLLVYGMQHTVIKFFSSYKNQEDKDGFLITSLVLPLLIIIPLSLIGAYFYEFIATWISDENPMIKKYTYLIFITAIFMGYFEVFYAWTKVQFNSVFGNFLNEVFVRICTSLLLFAVYFNWINDEQFIYAVVGVYGLKAIIMKLYALYIYKPKLIFKLPENIKEILSFSTYIIVAGSAAGVLLEIDKFMIPQMEQIAQVAYYSVGVYIASVIAIPTRAMQQITSPITAKEMNENNIPEVEKLYKQTSINLLVAGGLLFLLINLNITELYELINKPQFTSGIWIVLIISCAKLIELATGTGNAILINSKFYKMFFYVSLAMAVSVIWLNKWLIELIGINGAAVATLIVMAVYSIIKTVFIMFKLKIQPFGVNTLKILLLIGIMYFVLSFWNFEIHPILNILLKSIVIVGSYLVFIRGFHISEDVTLQFNKFLNRK
jgi:O-antigen/teichoic acid export membrane protein